MVSSVVFFAFDHPPKKYLLPHWIYFGPCKAEDMYGALYRHSLNSIIGFVMEEIGNTLAFVKNNVCRPMEDALCST